MSEFNTFIVFIIFLKTLLGFGDRDRVGDRVGEDNPIKERTFSDDVPTSDSPDWLNPYVIMLIVIVVLLCIIGFMAFYIVLTRRKKKPRTPNAHTVESEPLNGLTGRHATWKRSGNFGAIL